jgi:carbamoyltransferase
VKIRFGMKDKYILGISCGFHDSAACLVKNGKVLGACEEERFTGIKHDSSFPTNTINWLLSEKGLTGRDIDIVTFYESPDLKLDRIKKTSKKTLLQKLNPFNSAVTRNRLQNQKFKNEIYKITHKDVVLVYGNHHLSHAGYGFYTSDFKNSTIVSVDGVGEWETTSIYFGNQNKIIQLKNVNFPHSLGMLYSAFTAYLGFKPNEGEYKVMGLAPYGNSNRFKSKFDKLYTLDDDGLFSLNMKYFTFEYSEIDMFNLNLPKLFGVPNRLPEDELTQDHKDIAAGLQELYEFLFFKLLNLAYKMTKNDNLVLVGGCAYNGTANGKILELTPFKNIHIPSAPSDAGSSIGSALHYYYSEYKWETDIDNSNPFLGPMFSKRQIKTILDENSKDVWYEELPEYGLVKKISKEITEGNVVGWFDGRIEFGARALGNRSILANPRDPQMNSRVNRVIKKREGFRPFAPMVLKEYQSTFFNYKQDVPYMNQVVSVKDEYKNSLPAITHVDGSARIQTVYDEVTPRIARLLKQLQIDNKYPIVLNTSFNLKDQTMVLDPKTAIQTFLNCEMDTLVLGNFVVKKTIT